MSSSNDVPVAVVTGAARGLGRATALRLGVAGYRIVVTARSSRDRRHPMFAGTVEDVSDELERAGIEAYAIPADLATEGAPGEIHAKTIERFGRCDVLVNNAAYSPVEPFLLMPPSKWRAALMVNVWAPTALTRWFLPAMVERGSGAIINVSSGSAVENIPSTAPYCVTKAALERLTETVAAEIAGSDVIVTSVRIAERIATEADLMMRSRGIGDSGAVADETSPEQFAEALLWMVGQKRLQGRTLTLAELRASGAIAGN